MYILLEEIMVLDQHEMHKYIIWRKINGIWYRVHYMNMMIIHVVGLKEIINQNIMEWLVLLDIHSNYRVLSIMIKKVINGYLIVNIHILPMLMIMVMTMTQNYRLREWYRLINNERMNSESEHSTTVIGLFQSIQFCHKIVLIIITLHHKNGRIRIRTSRTYLAHAFLWQIVHSSLVSSYKQKNVTRCGFLHISNDSNIGFSQTLKSFTTIIKLWYLPTLNVVYKAKIPLNNAHGRWFWEITGLYNICTFSVVSTDYKCWGY